MSFRDDLHNQGLEIPYSTDTSLFTVPLVLWNKKIPNRIGILPLEGYDSEKDGSPSPHVYRRYLRYVEGGSGLIWFEACAVSEDGKSNPLQMMLHDDNVNAFRDLIRAMDSKAASSGRDPSFKVLQLTHSGRLSMDANWNSIALSPKKLNDLDTAILASDEQIAKMVQEHIHAAKLAADAGFDAVDIKVCHGYFLCELLSAFHREGRYGGSFENRTRAIFEIIDGIREEVGDRIGISVRLNAFDSLPYPDGFGVIDEDGRKKPDLSETIRLCTLLRDHGVRLINISASAPRERLFGPAPTDPKYLKYGTPCDYLMAVKLLKEKVPEICFMCTGLSSFGSQGGFIAAGGIAEHWFDIAGFGRQALAYPSFANDLLTCGSMDARKCCLDCGKCFRLMDCRSMIGCIVRDREEFFPLYRKYVLGKEDETGEEIN